MIPKVGDVFIVDLGYEAKVRPVVVVSREDPNAPRAMLRLQSYANVQAMNSAEHHELTERRRRFDAAAMAQIREAIRWALEL